MSDSLTENDVGKWAFTPEGERVGRVDEVTDDGFYVRYDESAAVVWDGDRERRKLAGSVVDRVDDDAVYLGANPFER